MSTPPPPLVDPSGAAPGSDAPRWRRLAAFWSEPDRRLRAWRWVQIILLALFAFVLLRTAWVSDDAYITLRTVDNFAHGFGLRWNIAERVQTFTHPLWLALISGLYALTHSEYYTVVFLSIVVSLAAFALIAWRTAGPPSCVALALAALLSSRAFTDYSTSGLENPLTHLLVVVFILLLPGGPPDRRRLFLLAAVAGLLVLNRMDAGLLVAPGLAYALLSFRRPRGLLVAAIGFAPFVAWEIFAVFYYGLPYPNTALAKLGSGIPAGELARQGVFYLGNSLRCDPVTLTVIGAGVLAAALRQSGRALAVAAGVVLYLLSVLSKITGF